MDWAMQLVLKLKPTGWLSSPSRRAAGEVLAERDKVIGDACTVFFPSDPLHVVRGEGQYLYDETGSKYLDCISNVQNVGHCHPEVVKAAAEQMGQTNCNNRFLHESIVECATAITATLPQPLSKCFFVNSGSEANDLALRISGDFTDGTEVIVLDHAYHGHVDSMIKISPYKFNGRGGKGKPDWVHIAPVPDVYNGKFRLSDEEMKDPVKLEELAEKYADEVGMIIEQMRKEGKKLRAFYMESLQSCGGQIIPPPGYLRRILQHVHGAGGVVVADEVQTGFGRAGRTFWAFQLQGDDAIPDIVTMGKPMGNGFPVSALVTRPEISQKFGGGMQYFNTFGGNPVSCAVVLAVLRSIKREGLQAQAQAVGDYLLAELNLIKAKHPAIGDVRGVGYFIGIELVSNPETREPAPELANAVINRLRRPHKVILSAEGPHANILKFKPPLCFSKANADEAHLTSDLRPRLDSSSGLQEGVQCICRRFDPYSTPNRNLWLDVFPQQTGNPHPQGIAN